MGTLKEVRRAPLGVASLGLTDVHVRWTRADSGSVLSAGRESGSAPEGHATHVSGDCLRTGGWRLVVAAICFLCCTPEHGRAADAGFLRIEMVREGSKYNLSYYIRGTKLVKPGSDVRVDSVSGNEVFPPLVFSCANPPSTAKRQIDGGRGGRFLSKEDLARLFDEFDNQRLWGKKSIPCLVSYVASSDGMMTQKPAVIGPTPVTPIWPWLPLPNYGGRFMDDLCDVLWRRLLVLSTAGIPYQLKRPMDTRLRPYGTYDPNLYGKRAWWYVGPSGVFNPALPTADTGPTLNCTTFVMSMFDQADGAGHEDVLIRRINRIFAEKERWSYDDFRFAQFVPVSLPSGWLTSDDARSLSGGLPADLSRTAKRYVEHTDQIVENKKVVTPLREQLRSVDLPKYFTASQMLRYMYSKEPPRVFIGLKFLYKPDKPVRPGKPAEYFLKAQHVFIIVRAGPDFDVLESNDYAMNMQAWQACGSPPRTGVLRWDVDMYFGCALFPKNLRSRYVLDSTADSGYTNSWEELDWRDDKRLDYRSNLRKTYNYYRLWELRTIAGYYGS